MNSKLLKIQVPSPVILKHSLSLVSFFILPLVACPLWGQVMQKKQLQESDYSKWGELIVDKNSSDAQWVSYRMLYENENDTLFVRNTQTLKTYNFPKAVFPVFAGSNYLFCKDSQYRYVLNLTTGKKQSYPKSTQIDYALAVDQIVIFSKEKSTLTFTNPVTDTDQSINQIFSYKMSPTGKEAIIVKYVNNKYSIGLLNLKAGFDIKWIFEDKDSKFYNFSWQEEGKAVVFYSTSDTSADETNLNFYNLKTQKLYILNSKKAGFPTDKTLDEERTYPLSVSSDLQHVFLGLKPVLIQSEKKDKDKVEIWNTADRWIYPLEQKSGKFNEKVSLGAWRLSDNQIIVLSSAEFPKVLLTGNKTHAIISNPKEYEPQFEPYGPRDFYIINLITGGKEILVKNQSEFYADLLPSPAGKYIAYFKENNWWIYDIKLKSHTNITEKIKFPFYGRINILDSETAYGNAGWSENDNEILLYDQYDIWAVKPDGKSFRRLTKGREDKIKFRINTLIVQDSYISNYDGSKSVKIDLTKKLILLAEGDDQSSGYYCLNKNKLDKIVYTNSYLSDMQYFENKDTYLYTEQRFDMSPRLVLRKNNSPEKIIFQSNPHREKYYWGSAELINFTTSKGKQAKGILYYPADYDPAKKYPMIVHIYEKQSSSFHHYINPTFYTGTGFNAAVMTANGYFVLCPDIQHETGTVGENTVDFTISAVKYIINRNVVNTKKIGLMGHSFGGYETNFVITQTDIFRAAISGGSISDLTSFYLNVGWALSISDMARFQSQQWRIGKTPFEDPALYAKNSPVANVSNVHTPLLLWSGKEDWHTNWHQSIEFYMALRRLKKPGVMLLYPEEHHVLTKPFNQKKHSLKVMQWFDYYLKDNHSFKWIDEIN